MVGKAKWGRGLLNATGELIAEEGFDGVGFVKHFIQAQVESAPKVSSEKCGS